MYERIRSSDFDRVITIEENLPNKLDTHNEPVENWQPFMSNVKCNIMPMKGREKVEQNTVTAISDQVLVMRWVKNLTTDMRIYEHYHKEYHDILDKQEIGRRRGYKLMIRKKDNAQH